MTPSAYSGPTFIKPDQHDLWIRDQLRNALLSTILSLQLPNFVSCGRAWQESDFNLILDPWIKLIWFDKSGAWATHLLVHAIKCFKEHEYFFIPHLSQLWYFHHYFLYTSITHNLKHKSIHRSVWSIYIYVYIYIYIIIIIICKCLMAREATLRNMGKRTTEIKTNTINEMKAHFNFPMILLYWYK